MSVTVEGNVIYRWFDVREDELENIEPWTAVAVKIREITRDVKDMAIALAPEGRARDDQWEQIKSSHYQAAGFKRTGKSYSQVVGNRAPHARWVHEGTDHIPRFPVVKKGKNWMGPVYLGMMTGQVSLAPGPPKGQKRSGDTATWKAYPGFVFFRNYLWRGQKANPWLDRAGSAAYRLPGNH